MDNELLQKKLAEMQAKYGIKPPEEKEDAFPYNENGGTAENIGRFALSNLANDQLSGFMPVAGSLKAVTEAATEVPQLAKMMGRAVPEVAGLAKTGAEVAAEQTPFIANVAKKPTMLDMMRETSRKGREGYMSDVAKANAETSKAAKLEALKKLGQ